MSGDMLASLLNLVVVAALVLVAVTRVVRVAAGRGRSSLLAAVSLLAGVLWAVLSALAVWTLSTAVAVPPPDATDPGDPCPAGAPTRTFDVSLINIPLFLNRFGDVVPEGRMYVLDENIAQVRTTFQDAANPFQPKDLIEPLTLRVNRNDCVQVNFTNRLNEPAPGFNRDESIFTLPGETLHPAGTITPGPREFASARTQPDIDFDPANAPRASMHFTGLDYDVRGSDGTAAGNNSASTVAAGAARSYRLFADEQGEFHFHDGADMSSHQARAGNFIGSTVFGAFGAMIVEPEDADWVHPSTGGPLESGTRAIITDPDGPDFREHVLFMHGEVQAEPGILTRFCRSSDEQPEPDRSECVDPSAEELDKLTAGTLPGLGGGDADALVNGEVPVKLEWFAFNYRSEPGYNREEVDCPALTDPGSRFQAAECVGEEVSLSSWPFGDPGGGDLVFANYRNEPTLTRLVHGAGQETHTFHQHVNRWPFDKNDEGGIQNIARPEFHTNVTNPIDTQAVSPGAHYSLAMEGGAGSPHDETPGSVGDVIFHCHLYPHFAEGMWGLNRVHDVLEDGTRQNPDGTPIPALVPLADFDYDRQPDNGVTPPQQPTAGQPGFPLFVPGEFGFKAPKPPLGVPSRQPGGVFPPTEQEIAAADPNARVPGAFFVDHCPANAPLKRFDVAAIQLDVTYNQETGWHNPQQRIYVLQEHKQAVLDGTMKPEPFTPLLNVGDCVEYHLTNELPGEYGGTVFDRLQETNEVSIHQHMVEFDVLSSDGAANGWNYDQGADSEGPDDTIVYRDFVQDDVRTNSFHDHFFPNVHQDAGLFGGGVVHPAGCTFHDPRTGREVRIGTIVDVRCGPAVDYHGNVTTENDSARSVALFSEDQVPMFAPEDPNLAYDQNFLTTLPDGTQGVPIYPSKFPSSNDDRGAMGVNYSLEPFEGRRSFGPGNLFSSKGGNGDPRTPIPRAYANDLVKFHLFDLSMEESHGFNLHRFRWQYEPDEDAGESRVQQAQHIGMLEYFEARVPVDKENPDPKGYEIRDYLYYYGGADDWFLGAWGLMRVSGCDFNKQIKSLQDLHGVKFDPLEPLPNNPPRPCDKEDNPTRQIGDPCPTSAPIRKYHVVAINKDITYNDAGDHDPNGLMYVLAEDLSAIRDGTQAPEPLLIRANQGDCIEVMLDNQLDRDQTQAHCFEALEPGQLGFVDPSSGRLSLPDCLDAPPDDENEVPGFQPFPVGKRVSLNPKGVKYEIGSDGANVGLNFDTTVGPGESILYRWYAPEQFGLGLLADRGDVQNHLHHGLFGGLIIEPKGSTYLDPRTGAEITSGQQAVIVDPNGPDFRENVVLMNSDLALFRQDGQPVPDNVDLAVQPSQEANDPEDQGEFSINYRNEPWNHRFQNNPDLAQIYSSFAHGDPATPVFRAYPGDQVRFLVAQAQGDPRSTSFALHGHRWRRSPNDPESQLAATQGEFNPGSTYEVRLDPHIFGGAGGPNGLPGDYLYRSNTPLRHLPGGQWGIFRVLDSWQPDLIELPDNPR